MEALSIRDFCLELLLSGDLETKLRPPPSDLRDDEPGPARRVGEPARATGLQLVPGAPRLPKPAELNDPAARATCLARFAHHELMAAELFAWALLRWPALPAPLRLGLLEVLADEQRHCHMYLERLRAHESELEQHPLSDYFWKHEPAMAASPHGPRAFLAGMGLTLEQANLDFSLVYRDAFRSAGDEQSALVCERVHADEVRHVRLASTWLERLTPAGTSEIEAYEQAVPFPLGATRAKGRHFDAAGRRSAGLGEAYIEHVRSARPRPSLRTPR